MKHFEGQIPNTSVPMLVKCHTMLGRAVKVYNSSSRQDTKLVVVYDTEVELLEKEKGR